MEGTVRQPKQENDMIDTIEAQNRFAAHKAHIEHVNREAWQLEEPPAASRPRSSPVGASIDRAYRFRLPALVARPVTALRAALGLL